MAREELLIAKKKHGKLNFKIVNKEFNRWSPEKYQRIIAGKNYNSLAYLFYELWMMGYDIHKAYAKFKEIISEPELFFLK